MHPLRRLFSLGVLLVCIAVPAAAQEPPPRIGPFVLDLRGAIPLFPGGAALAESRGLAETSLPGNGLGLEAGLHLYLFSWKAVTIGIGAELLIARARHTPPLVNGTPFGPPVTERFTSFAPQLSLNFGTGNGWSYLSGGLGGAVWSIVPDGADPRAQDEERLRAFNYGGGARWFARRHLAFSVDGRFYAVDPGTVFPPFPGSPRSTFLVFSAGISVK